MYIYIVLCIFWTSIKIGSIFFYIIATFCTTECNISQIWLFFFTSYHWFPMLHHCRTLYLMCTFVECLHPVVFSKTKTKKRSVPLLTVGFNRSHGSLQQPLQRHLLRVKARVRDRGQERRRLHPQEQVRHQGLPHRPLLLSAAALPLLLHLQAGNTPQWAGESPPSVMNYRRTFEQENPNPNLGFWMTIKEMEKKPQNISYMLDLHITHYT